MSITAVVEKNAIKLPPGAGLPDGTRVRIEPVDPTEPSAPAIPFGRRYAEFIGAVQDAPPDLAQNHDHYLYGARKQTT